MEIISFEIGVPVFESFCLGFGERLVENCGPDSVGPTIHMGINENGGTFFGCDVWCR